MVHTINDISEFDKLYPEQQIQLVTWCEKSLIQIKNITNCRSSYGLKHDFEYSTDGFYISNGAFKGAMIKAGFKYKEYIGSPNWHFNISKKSVKRVRELNRMY